VGEVAAVAAGPGIEGGFVVESGEFLGSETRGFVVGRDAVALAGAGDEEGADGGFPRSDAGFDTAGCGPGDVFVAAEQDGFAAVLAPESGEAGVFGVEFGLERFGHEGGRS
jgi:hypothetical protein